MPEKRWKRKEREIARLLGGKRNVEKGVPQPDVEGPDFVIQVKDRQRVPTFLFDAVRDAEEHAERLGKPYAMAVLTTSNTHTALVIFPLRVGETDNFWRLWNARKTDK